MTEVQRARGPLPKRQRRRRNRMRASGEVWPTHLDLENVMVSLALVESGGTNVLRGLGYRLVTYDADLSLVAEAADGQKTRVLSPDATCYADEHGHLLVMECKSGSIAFHQVPEGDSTFDKRAWASATKATDPDSIVSASGLIIASEASVERYREKIDERGTSALAVGPSTASLDPDHAADRRLRAAIAGIRVDLWPTSYIPFNAERLLGWEAQVIAAIGPVLMEALGNATPSLTAREIAERTHFAVWVFTSKNRQSAWINKVDGVLRTIGNRAAFEPILAYEPAIRTLTFHTGRFNPKGMQAALRHGLDLLHRPRSPKAPRVRKAVRGPDQMAFEWPDQD